MGSSLLWEVKEYKSFISNTTQIFIEIFYLFQSTAMTFAAIISGWTYYGGEDGVIKILTGDKLKSPIRPSMFNSTQPFHNNFLSLGAPRY